MAQTTYEQASAIVTSPEATTHRTGSRRHDVDWLRVLALGLLIFFHVHLCFQPWSHEVHFIQNEDPLPYLWFTMKMLDIWRIPLLFVISGMGVYFAMRNRDWKQLLQERTARILLPYITGFLFICPITIFFAASYYDEPFSYVPNSGHLWFLLNIFLYVLILLPLFTYVSHHPDNVLTRTIDKALQQNWGIFVFLLPLMAEAVLINPAYFSSYVRTAYGLMTVHGFLYGLICFALGFLLVARGELFWNALQRTRYSALAIASMLYLVRLLVFKLQGFPNVLIALESGCWILVMLAFGSLYLNKPSALLRYLSKAVFPVYIVHLPVLFGLAYVLFPLDLPAMIKIVVLLTGTLGLSLLIYEGLKRLLWLRPLFGMPLRRAAA